VSHEKCITDPLVPVDAPVPLVVDEPLADVELADCAPPAPLVEPELALAWVEVAVVVCADVAPPAAVALGVELDPHAAASAHATIEPLASPSTRAAPHRRSRLGSAATTLPSSAGRRADVLIAPNDNGFPWDGDEARRGALAHMQQTVIGFDVVIVPVTGAWLGPWQAMVSGSKVSVADWSRSISPPCTIAQALLAGSVTAWPVQPAAGYTLSVPVQLLADDWHCLLQSSHVRASATSEGAYTT
jgi:hypothetical protein